MFKNNFPDSQIRIQGKVKNTSKILGISAHYHDSSACLLVDGKIIAACQEERFSRIKNDPSFPMKSIRYCLKVAGIEMKDVDIIAYYEDPYIKIDRDYQILSMLQQENNSLPPSKIKSYVNNFHLEDNIRTSLNYDGPIGFVQHHVSHLASSFLTSNFRESAGLVVDGVGEWKTTTLWTAHANKFSALSSTNYPDSLGLFYAAMTSFLGFRVNIDEYKVMALAAYGRPIYLQKINKLLEVSKSGEVRINHDYFDFVGEGLMYKQSLGQYLDLRPQKHPGAGQEYCDLAASVQSALETSLTSILASLHRLSGQMKNLSVAGGVGLNGLAVYKSFQKSRFRNIHMITAPGDAGAALGAALFTHKMAFAKSLRSIPVFNPFVGPEFSGKDIRRAFQNKGLTTEKYSDEEVIELTAKALHLGLIVAWFQGRMEFGPRALGARSILANPLIPGVKNLINQKIKSRELFRPLAPSMTPECAREILDIPELYGPIRFMQFVVPMKPKFTKLLSAVTNVDGTCRPQLVTKQSNARFHKLLTAFKRYSGYSILLNTSFNINEEPIVCSPINAVNSFINSNIDVLVIGNYYATKK
jgi:carbamoyltransferase